MSAFTEADHTAPERPVEPQAPVSKLAIAALVTGILPLVPLAVGLGVSALVTIGRTGRRGRGLAIGALAGAAGWLIVAAVVGGSAYLTHGFHTTVTVRYKQSAVFSLREGDCLDMRSEQAVALEPCSSPHDAEVYATFTLHRSAWPGTAAVAQAARSGCASRLTGYLNQQLAITFSQDYVYPSETAWKAGTRTVICEISAASGQLSQSVRGA